MTPSRPRARRPPGGLRRPVALRGHAVGVLGLGLMGGSLLKGLASHRPALDVLGHDRSPDLSWAARRFGTWCASVESLVTGSDVLVLCVPVPASIALLPAIARAARRRTRRRRLIVSDVGSMKVSVAAEAARWRRDFDYVGLHPLAGGEHNGWNASDAGLFRGRPIVHCPSGSRETRIARELVRLIGGVPVAMEAAAHDAMAAETIGLPHLAAFAAAALRPPATEPHPLRGTSWGSLTRVSVSDPAFVAGLLQPNAANQLRVARAFIRRFQALCRHLERPAGRELEQALRRAAGKR